MLSFGNIKLAGIKTLMAFNLGFLTGVMLTVYHWPLYIFTVYALSILFILLLVIKIIKKKHDKAEAQEVADCDYTWEHRAYRRRREGEMDI